MENINNYDEFYYQIYRAQNPEEILAICSKVERLATTILEIQSKYQDKTISYYKIDDEINEPKLENRHLFLRLGTALLFPLIGETHAKERLASLLKRVLGIPQKKKIGSENKIPLLVNVFHLPLFISSAREAPEAWFVDCERVRQRYGQVKQISMDAMSVVHDWKFLYGDELLPDILSRINLCIAKYANVRTFEFERLIPPLQERVNIDLENEFLTEVELLLKSDSSKIDLPFKEVSNNIKSTKKVTILQYAIINKMSQKIIEEILNHGASLTAPDSEGQTLFDYYEKKLADKDETYDYLFHIHHILLEFNQIPIIKMNDLNQEGINLLHDACSKNILPLVRFFLKKGMDVNCKDRRGNTPLILASKYGHLAIMRELSLSQEIRLSDVNNDGLTAEQLYEEYYSACDHMINEEHSARLKELGRQQFYLIVKHQEGI